MKWGFFLYADGGPRLWHQRLVLGRAGSSETDVVVASPDFDDFNEEARLWCGDLAAMRFSETQRPPPPGVACDETYRFNFRALTATKMRELIAEGEVAAAQHSGLWPVAEASHTGCRREELWCPWTRRLRPHRRRPRPRPGPWRCRRMCGCSSRRRRLDVGAIRSPSLAGSCSAAASASSRWARSWSPSVASARKDRETMRDPRPPAMRGSWTGPRLGRLVSPGPGGTCATVSRQRSSRTGRRMGHERSAGAAPSSIAVEEGQVTTTAGEWPVTG